MSKEIEVNTNTLAADIEKLQNELNLVVSELNKMYDAVNLLDSMWDGPANDTFRAQFLQDRQEMQEICNELQKMNDCLVYAKNEYNTCENNINGIVTSIRI